MKRDWERIKEVLTDVEALELHRAQEYVSSRTKCCSIHARLLSRNGYLLVRNQTARNLLIEDLTLRGHDLLDRLRDGDCGPSPLAD